MFFCIINNKCFFTVFTKLFKNIYFLIKWVNFLRVSEILLLSTFSSNKRLGSDSDLAILSSLSKEKG